MGIVRFHSAGGGPTRQVIAGRRVNVAKAANSKELVVRAGAREPRVLSGRSGAAAAGRSSPRAARLTRRLLSAALALAIPASLTISAPLAHSAREKAGGSTAAGESAKAYTGMEVADGGAVTGYVVAHDPPRPRRDYPVTSDRRVCGDHVPDESLLVSKVGRVANVVVSIEGIRKGRPVDRRVRPRLAAAGCRFVPHVLAVSVGQKIVIYNGDPLLHTVRAVMDPHTTVFDVSLPVQNQKIPKLITSPGIMKLDSDAGHVWMSGWILAFEHPYFAVTGDDGTFSIKGLPPGTYEIRAWHEVLGTQVAKVTISPGATSEIVFDALSNAPTGG